MCLLTLQRFYSLILIFKNDLKGNFDKEHCAHLIIFSGQKCLREFEELHAWSGKGRTNTKSLSLKIWENKQL